MDNLSYKTRPKVALIAAFASFKAFLFSIAIAASVAPDYDTSTSLFFTLIYPNATPSALAQQLTRWDALYFIHASTLGKTYEQEWAFGWGLSGLVSMLSSSGEGVVEPLIAIAIANLSHLGSVLALYELTKLITKNVRFSFVAALLHVLSPAGLFLSAPYAESTFSCLTFVGDWLFALSYTKQSALGRNALLVGAGGVLGISTVFRSNGLGSGLLFAVEAARGSVTFLQKPGLREFTRLVATVIGGLCIAVGAVAPQYVAWVRYCNSDSLRPWCSKAIPSIFTFVQEHYWNVGFLRYWTPNQIPLFLLASPVLALLIVSGWRMLQNPKSLSASPEHQVFIRALAATQLFVAVLAITNYHVQIINRLSSGYVVWYWWVAGCILSKERQGLGLGIVSFFVMYAGIQGGLFASFLPPA